MKCSSDFSWEAQIKQINTETFKPKQQGPRYVKLRTHWIIFHQLSNMSLLYLPNYLANSVLFVTFFSDYFHNLQAQATITLMTSQLYN